MHPKVVFDFEQDDAISVGNLFRHLSNLQEYYIEGCTLEVVTYGPGLSLLLQTSHSAAQVSGLIDNGVKFIACQNTMKRLHISDESLIAGAIQTKSGLGYIVDRQLDGWAYIKS